MTILLIMLFLCGSLIAQDNKQDETEKRLKELEEEVEGLKKKLEEEKMPEQPQRTLNIFNPAIAVIGNSFLRLDDKKVTIIEDGTVKRIDDSFIQRDAELDFRAAIDPFADGVFIVSVESEVPGEFEVDPEEIYINIKRLPVAVLDEPPLGLKLKAGRFRTEFGTINLLHFHDYPQTTAPLSIEEFLGEEGYIQSGLSGQIFLPTPFDEESTLNLTLQALQGGDIAVAKDGKHDFAYLANLAWFRTFADEHNFDTRSIVHYGYTDEDGKHPALTYSLDFLYKWKPLKKGEWHSFLIGSQLFYSHREFQETGAITKTESPFGYFAFTQYQLSRRTYVGARWDYTEKITNDSKERRKVTPYISWYASEFLRFRLSWEHTFSDLKDEDGLDTFLLELNFVFGAHPPEPFWVNR